MKSRAVEPPASHESTLNVPTRRPGRRDGGGAGYIRGGTMGKCEGYLFYSEEGEDGQTLWVGRSVVCKLMETNMQEAHTTSRSSSCTSPSDRPFSERKRRLDSWSWWMTWGELRKCRARSRSSERWSAGVGDGDGDDACSWSDEELGGGELVERGWDGPASGCEPSSSLLAVIAKVVKSREVSFTDSPSRSTRTN